MFVGRNRELGLLVAAHDRALRGQGGALVVRGGPGIGKTALIDAALRSWATPAVRAACWEVGGAPPHWPWTQALGPVDPTLSPFAIAEELVRRVLDRCGTGLVVWLDDAHVADPGSLVVLRRLAAEAPSHRLLVIATRRDVGAPRDPGVAAIDRLGEVVALDGLDHAEAAQLWVERRGRSGTDIAAILESTGGNPFLIGEVAAAGPSAHGVRDLVLSHLAHLPPSVVRTLEALAVVGRPLSLSLLERIARDAEVATHLALAAAERVAVVERGEARLIHALLRDTLYDAIEAGRRRDLHASAATVLEAGITPPEPRVLPVAKQVSA